ncbi:AAEL013388-PA [Aedes aegypti]|uniref:AAEL013388-PA n=1 Tax=Aedes aegypti TaxID=7159 RepID=Q16JB5_AEDAE|nr:AAEL013388-PA [Aedes aegypti]
MPTIFSATRRKNHTAKWYRSRNSIPRNAPSEAFEIPLDDENPDSLIKKHPPLRLKRLEEHTTTPPSIEDLEGKLATAEIRRQQFLASRAQKTTTIDKPDNDENGDVNAIEEEDEAEKCDTKAETVEAIESKEEEVDQKEEVGGEEESSKCDAQEDVQKES